MEYGYKKVGNREEFFKLCNKALFLEGYDYVVRYHISLKEAINILKREGKDRNKEKVREIRQLEVKPLSENFANFLDKSSPKNFEAVGSNPTQGKS